MKHSETYAHLRIYHAPAPEANGFFTQKNMDLAVILVSVAGLISATAFLLTMA